MKNSKTSYPPLFLQAIEEIREDLSDQSTPHKQKLMLAHARQTNSEPYFSETYNNNKGKIEALNDARHVESRHIEVEKPEREIIEESFVISHFLPNKQNKDEDLSKVEAERPGIKKIESRQIEKIGEGRYIQRLGIGPTNPVLKINFSYQSPDLVTLKQNYSTQNFQRPLSSVSSPSAVGFTIYRGANR